MGFYKDLKDLNENLYHNPTSDFKEFKWIDTYENDGLLLSLYKYKDRHVLAIKGTDVTLSLKGLYISIDDARNDIAIYRKHLPKQSFSVEKYYQEIKDKYNDILVTGYSLGGSLAQILGSRNHLETITFCSVGTKELCGDTSTILNFGNLLDYCFMRNFSQQVGKIMIMAIGTPPKHYPSGNRSIKYHFYSDYGNPDTAVELDRSRLVNYAKDYLI